MFNGIQPRKYREVLRCLNATVREYPRGAHIVELGVQSHNTGVLLDGTIEEFLYDENGNQISICRFCPGEVFGAELACTGWTASPVCLRASSDCTVMLLDFSALMSQKTLTCPCRMQVTANLMQDMAQLAKRSAAMKAPVGLLSGSAVLRKQDGGALPRQALPQQDHFGNADALQK